VGGASYIVFYLVYLGVRKLGWGKPNRVLNLLLRYTHYAPSIQVKRDDDLGENVNDVTRQFWSKLTKINM